jgi:hypothetical protein
MAHDGWELAFKPNYPKRPNMQTFGHERWKKQVSKGILAFWKNPIGSFFGTLISTAKYFAKDLALRTGF